jgi:transcriptional regulator with XRE-family HTH domain
MTPAQCRAARGLLNWNQDHLALAARVSVVTVRNFENDKSTPQRATLDVIQRALEAADIEFISENGGGPGVRLRKPVAAPTEPTRVSKPAGGTKKTASRKKTRPRRS